MEFDRGIRTDLLDPVAEMRLAIMEAAIDCNYDELAELALAGRAEFTYSLGGGDDPGGRWREAED